MLDKIKEKQLAFFCHQRTQQEQKDVHHVFRLLPGALSMHNQWEPIFLSSCPRPFSVPVADTVVLVSLRPQTHNHCICHCISTHTDHWGVD